MFGHLAGNDCMRKAGQATLAWAERELAGWPFGVCATFGGDEVIVAAAGAPYAGFREAVTRLRDALATAMPCTCSFAVASAGVTTPVEDAARAYRSLVTHVDRALFDRKDELRGRGEDPTGELVDAGVIELPTDPPAPASREIIARAMASDDLFKDTAHYYAEYRPRYPDELLDAVLELVPGGRGDLLVDWGCGTGEVAIPLSRSFERVTAVDADPDMVAVARRKAAEAGIANVEWITGKAEDVPLEPESCDLITSGSAFHWMARESLSARAYEALRRGRGLVLIGGGSSVWDDNAEWHSVAVRCLRKHLGEPRRAGSGTYEVTKKHEDYLGPAGFRIEDRDYPTEKIWTADQIVGYLYSTSFAGLHVLGDRREAFERDLRAALAEASSDDAFREELDFYLKVSHKD